MSCVQIESVNVKRFKNQKIKMVLHYLATSKNFLKKVKTDFAPAKLSQDRNGIKLNF